MPKDPLAALVDWVEKGEPPETLEASTTTKDGELVTRDLCAWPGKPKYMGIGDANRASSWDCVGGTERATTGQGDSSDATGSSGRAGQILGGLKEKLKGLGMGLTIG
jgi:hypothetical protein